MSFYCCVDRPPSASTIISIFFFKIFAIFNVSIYNTEGDDEPKRMSQIEIHSGDILDISFAPDNGMSASTSRDRLIHILDANHLPTYTINDHSAAVTAVQFVHFNNKVFSRNEFTRVRVLTLTSTFLDSYA